MRFGTQSVQAVTRPGPIPERMHRTLSAEPLLIRAVKGEKVERAPAWMMRQAGRYQASYRELAKKHPSFREVCTARARDYKCQKSNMPFFWQTCT